jgi:hypothetical protein
MASLKNDSFSFYLSIAVLHQQGSPNQAVSTNLQKFAVILLYQQIKPSLLLE